LLNRYQDTASVRVVNMVIATDNNDTGLILVTPSYTYNQKDPLHTKLYSTPSHMITSPRKILSPNTRPFVVLLELRRVLGMQGRLAGAVDSSTVGVGRREAGIGIGTHSMRLGQLEHHYIPSRTNELVGATPS
jgi:hypothetical protein